MNKVSIVTVTYNCSDILNDTIQSCISQDYPNKEYIIIDGASTDGTIEIIKENELSIDFWLSEPDKGIYDAMNKGIQKATGDWIIFMNAGDYFADTSVLSRIFSQKLDSSIGVIWGNNNTITEKGILEGKRVIPFWEQKSQFRSMGFNHQSVFANLNILRTKHLLFDLSFKLAADYNMINTLYKQGYKFLYVPFSISTIDGVNGLSANNRRKQREEVARICECNKKLFFIVYNNYKSLRSGVKRILKKCKIIR